LENQGTRRKEKGESRAAAQKLHSKVHAFICKSPCQWDYTLLVFLLPDSIESSGQRACQQNGAFKDVHAGVTVNVQKKGERLLEWTMERLEWGE